MRKLFLSVVFLLIPLLVLAFEVEIDGIQYYSEGSEVIVRGAIGNIKGKVEIPSKISFEGNDYNVTSIGIYAFYGCSNITSISIPENVVSIGDYAFRGCSGFVSISLPECLTNIGAYAFSGCTNLSSIEIPGGVISIGDYAFYGCNSLTTIFIPENVTYIGNSAFVDCINLLTMSVASYNLAYDSRDNCNAIINSSNNTLIAGCKNSVIPETVIK